MSDTAKLADEGNSSTKTKKSSLGFASRTRTFVAASAEVCIGNFVYLRTFQSRMFVEVSEVDCRLFDYNQGLRLLSLQM